MMYRSSISVVPVLLCAVAGVAPTFGAAPPVLLGGTYTMRDMLDATNTNDFRTAGGGLYAHQSGWVPNFVEGSEPANGPLAQQNRKNVANLFKVGSATAVEGHVEYAFGDPAEWINQYRSYYAPNGLNADNASVNFLSGQDDFPGSGAYPTDNADAFDYIDRLKAAGIKSVSIILSPNFNTTDARDFKFDNAKWNDARARAIRGGGWTSDAPPTYFFNERDQNYRDWVIAETKWTNANGLKSTNIISPRTSGALFFAQAVQYVRYFENADAIPKQWVVENYVDPSSPPAGYLNRIGSEDNSNHLAYTAKWLINHVQGRPDTLDLFVRTSTTSATPSVGQNQFNTSAATNKQTLQSNAGAMSWFVDLDNLSPNATTNFYAAELSATKTGDVNNWAVAFSLNNVDVTAAVLAGGFTLVGSNILDGGERAEFKVTITPLASAGRAAFNLNLFAQANPNATRIADALSFAYTVPEPASLALVGMAGVLLRRRRGH